MIKETQNLTLKYWGWAIATPAITNLPHHHNFWQTEWVDYGNCSLITPESELKLCSGDMIFVPPGVEHFLRYDSECRICAFKFAVNLEEFNQVIKIPDDPVNRGIINAAIELIKSSFPPDKIEAITGNIIMPGDRYQIIMEHLLSGVMENFRNKNRTSNPMERTLKEMIWQDKQLTVEQAAEQFGFSRNHFSSLFKKSTGHTAKNFIDREKIEIIKNYLLYSNFNIGEIADATGFSSQFYLTHFFKRMTGTTPNNYKNKHLYE